MITPDIIAAAPVHPVTLKNPNTVEVGQGGGQPQGFRVPPPSMQLPTASGGMVPDMLMPAAQFQGGAPSGGASGGDVAPTGAAAQVRVSEGGSAAQ